jgi:hypothetical protein
MAFAAVASAWLTSFHGRELGNYLNRPDYVLVEFLEVARWNPILEVLRAAGALYLIPIQKRSQNCKACYIASARGLHVPAARDLGSIGLADYRIKYWLLRQTRREAAKTAFSNQCEFLGTNRTVKGYCVIWSHRTNRLTQFKSREDFRQGSGSSRVVTTARRGLRFFVVL